MNKKYIKNIINEVINEIIDIKNINDIPQLQQKQIGSDLKFIFPKGDKIYVVSYNLSTNYFIFGVYDPIKNSILTNIEVKDGTPQLTAQNVFSILRYIVDKYNTKAVNFEINGFTRGGIYDFYLKKHFKYFELIQLGNDQYELRKI